MSANVIENQKSKIENITSLLEIERLSVRYGARAVLQEVSLRVAPGQVVALIGPNGAGKSTLIRTASGVLHPSGGCVRVNGRPLHELGAQERARLVAVVPQARSLPPAFTVAETVLLGRTPHLNWLGQTSPQDEERAQEAMQRTATGTLAGRRIGELSGGEQQRVLLARALAQAAPILLLDEPTAHLDLQYQIHLLDLVRGLAQADGYSVLVALHDLNLAARYADQIALLAGGRLLAAGTPAEVLRAPILSQTYQVPLQVIPEGPGGWPWIGPA